MWGELIYPAAILLLKHGGRARQQGGLKWGRIITGVGLYLALEKAEESAGFGLAGGNSLLLLAVIVMSDIVFGLLLRRDRMLCFDLLAVGMYMAGQPGSLMLLILLLATLWGRMRGEELARRESARLALSQGTWIPS